MAEEEKNLGFFNLNSDGESAVVRILHKSVETIEHGDIHWVTQRDGKKKVVKCIGEGCPVCATGKSTPVHRVYIHLLDYSDNTEKVWGRTDKIVSQLKDIEDSWGDLSRCVLKITRVGNEFPKYTVIVQNPSACPPFTSTESVDKRVAYRCYNTRSKEELEEFLKTGTLPPHKKAEFVPKGEYKGGSPNVGSVRSNVPVSGSNYHVEQQGLNVAPFDADNVETKVDQKQNNDPFDYDPFATFMPKKV